MKRSQILFIFPALEIIGNRCIEQEKADQHKKNRLQTQKTKLNQPETCEQGRLQESRKLRYVYSPVPHVWLAGYPVCHQKQTPDLFLVTVLAGKRVVYKSPRNHCI